jgi:hypothetical protein
MRVIILNKKRIGVTMIIIGLMVVLLGVEISLDSRLKLAMLVQNNISSLKTYEEKDFSYKLPSTWITQKRDFGSKEITYHNEFTSEDNVINGFVEVWEISEDLKSFLDKSKEVSTKDNIVKDYNVTPIKISKYQGYLVSYTIMTSKDVYFKSYEYFLKDKSKFFRFSFFVRSENYKDNMTAIFKVLVETLKSNN